MKKACTSLLLLTLLASGAAAQEQSHFRNPVIRGDVPDPSVIRIKDTYYATGTSSEWAPFYPVFASKDLVNWKQTGHIFNRQPEWTSRSFWAPELFHHNGKVYCYYTARKKENGVSYIGVATADSPTQEFTDHGPLIEYGTEAIDAFVYDDNGQLYISWKAYGLDNRPIEILGSRLSADGLHLEGEPFTLLVDDERIGMEGQYHFKQGDYYYIVYAAHGCCGPTSDYDVYVARAKSYKGPYEKYAGNPILHGDQGEFLSCGHGTAVTAPDGRMFYLCHAYLKNEGFYAGRQPILQEMYVSPEDQWVHFKTGNVALTRQPLPSGRTVQKPETGFEDSFKGKRLKVEWTWNYPFTDIHASLKGGRLILAGTPKEGNRYGTALCLRAQAPDYTYETRIANSNNSFKGLTLYGDASNLLLWGMKGNRLILKMVKGKQETTLSETTYDGPPPYLRIKVENGCSPSFYWSKDGKQWDAASSSRALNGRELVQWDRVFRPGLIHIGDKEQAAEYEYFKVTE